MVRDSFGTFLKKIALKSKKKAMWRKLIKKWIAIYKSLIYRVFIAIWNKVNAFFWIEKLISQS
jgi:hypothetical protein